jgi:hypothetical protein
MGGWAAFAHFGGRFGASGISRRARVPEPVVLQIVWFLGPIRALLETLRANLSAKLQVGVVSEFRGKVPAHVPQLEPSTLLWWPRGELASRIQVEVHGVRTLLHLGIVQGIRSILVATALAAVGLGVATALAIPPLGAATRGRRRRPRSPSLGSVDRVLEVRDGVVIEWERRSAEALLH